MSEVRKISYIKIYIIWPSEMIKMGFPDMHAEHTVTWRAEKGKETVNLLEEKSQVFKCIEKHIHITGTDKIRWLIKDNNLARKLANTVHEASARNKVKISESVLKSFALIIKACKYELSKGRYKLQLAEKHLMLTTCPREMPKVQEVLLSEWTFWKILHITCPYIEWANCYNTQKKKSI